MYLKGTVQVQTLIRVISFYVVKANTLFLLLLHNLNKLNIYFNNLLNILISKNST